MSTSTPLQPRTAATRTAAAGTSAFQPVRVVSVDVVTGEVEAPLPGVAPAHLRARVLVRADGAPLGVVEVEAGTDEELLARVRRVAGTALLPAQGRPAATAPRSLPAGGSDGDAGARPDAGTGLPLVTVTVASLRNVAPTVECVRHVLASTHPRLEVVVVDNDADPAPLRTALDEAFAGDPRVRHAHEPRTGLSYARNKGIAEARGSIVVFTDDDVRVDRRWVERIVEAFDAEPDVACVTGAILPAELETQAQAWLEEYGGFHKGFRREVFNVTTHRRPERLYPYDSGRFGSGANVALRTQVARDLGGFAVDLGAGTLAHGGEDLDLLRRVVTAGHTLVYEPAALLWHAHRRSEEALRRQVFRYGVGLSATVTKWLLEDRRVAWDVLRRLPGGAVHVLSPGSRKNAARSASYPPVLSRLELLGLAVGPVAYLRSRRAARRAVAA